MTSQGSQTVSGGDKSKESSSREFDVVVKELKSYIRRKNELEYLADFSFEFRYEGIDQCGNVLDKKQGVI